MIIQWIGKFSTKQIIGFVIAVLVAIYIVWYVIEALDGFDPNFKPSTGTAGSVSYTHLTLPTNREV